MRTLGVNSQTHDLDWTVADGLDSVEQRVRQRLRFFRGTWFLAMTQGIPYLDDVLIREADAGLASRTMADAVRTVAGVTDVVSANVRVGPATAAEARADPRLSRRSYAEIVLLTNAGEMTVTV